MELLIVGGTLGFFLYGSLWAQFSPKAKAMTAVYDLVDATEEVKQ